MRPRNIPIDYVAGTTKNVYFEFDDETNLLAADPTIRIKQSIGSGDILLVKRISLDISPSLATGKCGFKFSPSDFDGWVSRTYRYELQLTLNRDIIVPILGDFRIYSSI